MSVSETMDNIMKEAFGKVDNFSYPTKSRFLGDDTALTTFSCTNSNLGKQDSSVSMISLRNPLPPVRMYCDSEVLSTYSSNGTRRAVLRSLKHSPKFPISTPKATEDTVSLLEISEGQRILTRKMLTKETGNIMTHPTITSGLKMSPDGTKLAWVVSDDVKFEHENKALGITTKMSNYKDYGEDMDNIYHTSLVVYDSVTDEVVVYGSPSEYGACQFTFASNNVIILQCVQLQTKRLLGLRSYTNRPFEIFAVKINEEEKKFVKLLEKIRLDPSVYRIDEKSCILFTQKFPEHFGGHNGQLCPECCRVDLENLTISDLKTHNVAMNLDKTASNIFLSAEEVVLTEIKGSYSTPVALNLNTFEVRELVKRAGTESYIVDDVSLDKKEILLRKSSANSLPQLLLLKENGELVPLTEEYVFDELKTSVETCGDDASVSMILTKEPKKFIVIPHGGPHGTTTTYFNRTPLIWALAGYSIAQVNYVGSLGVDIEKTKKIFGKAGTVDLADVVATVKMVREQFKPEKVFIWGWSHGGFLSSHMAAKHSDIVDACVIGAPVINFVSSYFTCDIPDWALVEAGITDECDGETEITPEVYEKLWNCSPLKYADGVNVPVLIAHGATDRRVPIGQSIELYQLLTRKGKKAHFLQYDGNGHSMLLRNAWDDMMVSTANFFNDPENF